MWIKKNKTNICRSVNVEINFAGVLEIQKRFKVTAQTGLLGGSHILMRFLLWQILKHVELFATQEF